METYKLKFTGLQLEIFRLLCVKAGRKLNQRQIAKFLHVSPTAVAKSLPKLEAKRLIKYRKIEGMNLTSIELNRENQDALHLKRVENLGMFYGSGLASFLMESYPGCTLILFGSYSKGEDLETSDIDIAVLGSKGKKLSSKSFEERLEKEIRINCYTNFKELNKELKENLCNGIIIFGGIEW